MQEKELEELKKNYIKNGVYSRDSFDEYMGKFFSMKTSNNRSFNYDYFFLELKKLDTELFQVINRFWRSWKDFKITDQRQQYQKMMNDLAEGLLKWKEGKILV